MDDEAFLRSPSVDHLSHAAIFLGNEGSLGAKHLPELLRCCKAIDFQQEQLDKCQEKLLGFGAMTFGDVVREVGFDPNDQLHLDIMNWVVFLTSSRHAEVVAYAIYGLGYLGSTHNSVVHCLQNLIMSEPRSGEHPNVSVRAIAFRMLARLDKNLAAEFRNTIACSEYLKAVDWWLSTAQSGPEHDLFKESSWLRTDHDDEVDE